jgi:hypothetical protein
VCVCVCVCVCVVSVYNSQECLLFVYKKTLDIPKHLFVY